MAERNKRNTRQRMINLMYLVFIAMLAMNISSEVLDGFDLMNENLNRALANSNTRKEQIYTEIANSYKVSPEKTEPVYLRANNIKEKSDNIFNQIQALKQEITIRTDGAEADVNNINRRDNLSASAEIMLNPLTKEGEKLRTQIELYREEIASLIGDSLKRNIIRSSLATEVTKKSRAEQLTEKKWEYSSFEGMPTIATLTYLTELQSNIRQAEGEVLNTIVKELDMADLRVNEVQAFVVPQSDVVMRGTNYSAKIFLAAQDTLQKPTIMVNGKELPKSADGNYVEGTSALGRRKISGFISLMSRDGHEIKKMFEHEYTVIEPMVTIAPLLMDVLYASYPNPISVSVPGMVRQDISVTATGGSLKESGANWIATPAKVGQDMTINVAIKQAGGRTQTLSKKFRVRQLPDPTAYIEYTDAGGNPKTFKRGAIPRAALLSAGGIKAAIDDGILNVPFKVLSFRTLSIDVMGNASPEITQGGNFSERQIEQMRRMQRGKTMFIASIMVQGPDGIQREIPPMEIRMN